MAAAAAVRRNRPTGDADERPLPLHPRRARGAPVSPPPLRLKRNEDRRIRAGHLWVYSNEVDVQATPLSAFQPGEPAVLLDHRGAPLGSVYVNPHSLICARVVSRDPRQTLDADLLRRRLAPRPRPARAPLPGPLLPPGLRRGRRRSRGWSSTASATRLVVQITTAGMQRLATELLDALEELVQPEGILLRNDTGTPRAGGARAVRATSRAARSRSGRRSRRTARASSSPCARARRRDGSTTTG